MKTLIALTIIYFMHGLFLATITFVSEIESIKWRMPKQKDFVKETKYFILILYRFLVIVFAWYFIIMSVFFEEAKR